jgi:long-chain acyl-CoA synthetase
MAARDEHGSDPRTPSGARSRGPSRKAAKEAIKPAPSDVACFIYTSGTTGNPKGVQAHARATSRATSARCTRSSRCRRTDRSLSFLPWAHSFGQTAELHMLFSMGASMGIAESVDKILDNLKEVQPTLLFSVPRIFNRSTTA